MTPDKQYELLLKMKEHYELMWKVYDSINQRKLRVAKYTKAPEWHKLDYHYCIIRLLNDILK